MKMLRLRSFKSQNASIILVFLEMNKLIIMNQRSYNLKEVLLRLSNKKFKNISKMMKEVKRFWYFNLKIQKVIFKKFHLKLSINQDLLQSQQIENYHKFLKTTQKKILLIRNLVLLSIMHLNILKVIWPNLNISFKYKVFKQAQFSFL